MFVAALVTQSALSASPEDKRRDYDASHFVDPMGVWSSLSTKGPDAEYGMGLLFDLGNGTPESPQYALMWYKLAADAGVPAAAFNVGAMYAAGRGVERNMETAGVWFARAAAEGHHRAEFDIAALYERGDGVPQNNAVAMAWYLRAIRGGITTAKERLSGLVKAAVVDKQDVPLVPAMAVWPNAGEALIRSLQSVPLVWTAPPEPRPVHYEVALQLMDDAKPSTIFMQSVDVTAILMRLPQEGGDYSWRVDTVDEHGARVSGHWTAFSVGQPAGMERSTTASGPKH